MAGRVQIQTVGPQDRLFTDDPEYTYFIKNFKKHGNYARFYDDLDFTGRVEFGEEIRCAIPQNQGDLLKGLSLKVTLGAIDQSLSPHDVTYCESIAQAMIEYADLYIGGTLVQRIPSDMLAIHSEIYVTQSKQSALRKLVGKPDQVFPVYTDLYTGVRDDRVQSSKVDTSYRVDLPFYFHEHPELAIPLHAITKQEVEIAIRFRKAEDCIFAVDLANPIGNDAATYYIGQNPSGLIKSVQLSTEMVTLQDKKFPKRVDYLITQTQTNTFDLNHADAKVDTLNQCNVHELKLDIINPVKELFFVIQDKFDKDPATVNDFATPYQYCANQFIDTHGFFTSSEHVKHIELEFDGETILNEVTGNMVHLRAIQPAKHHSRTTVYRRFYTYSFALEPESIQPSGQLNFSYVKNQIARVGLFDYSTNKDKQLRVYAQSYNILRVENGICTLLFDT
jgi:hypothetical protein